MIFPILIGVGYMAVEYLTFNLANMITFNVMNNPGFPYDFCRRSHRGIR